MVPATRSQTMRGRRSPFKRTPKIEHAESSIVDADMEA